MYAYIEKCGQELYTICDDIFIRSNVLRVRELLMSSCLLWTLL